MRCVRPRVRQWYLAQVASSRSAGALVVHAAPATFTSVFQRLERGARAGNGGRVVDLALQRLAADGKRVGYGLSAFGCIDNIVNFVVFDQVDNMRQNLYDLVDLVTFNAVFNQVLPGVAVGNQIKILLDELE